MRKSGLTRRQLLTGLGASSALLPFVPPLEADAATLATSRRLLIFGSPDGVGNLDAWAPTGSETSFTLSAQHKVLEPVKSQLVFLYNVELPAGLGSGGHNGCPCLVLTSQPSVLVGEKLPQAGGISVDQYVADKIGASTRFRSIELGVLPTLQRKWTPPSFIARSYRAAKQPVMPDFDPYTAFGRIFTTSNDPKARAEQEARMLDEGSVLDVVRADLLSMKQRILSTTDRLKLDAHEQALREIEKRLTPTVGGACDAAPVGNKVDINASANMPALGKVQMDIALAALSCDLTRVATVQFGQSLWEHSFPFLGLGTRLFHEMSHHFEDQLLKASAWLSQQYLYVVQKLAERPDPLGSGSMLDNTLVPWVNEFGNGDFHSGRPIPFMFAGGRNLWRTGRMLRYPSRVPVGDVLTTITHVMGAPVEKFGDPSFTAGPLKELLS